VWSARVAERRLAEILRLSDLADFEELVAEADGLWPAHARTVPAMERWLDRARALCARLDLHRATLASIRADALPYDDAARRRDREAHARLAALYVQRESRLFRVEQGGSREREWLAQLAEVEEEIERLEREVEANRTYAFADAGRAWQHERMQALVLGLEQLAGDSGLIDDIEARHLRASTLTRDTVEAYAGQWAEAARAIAASPRYGGLALAPQVGLVPLGSDPDSGLWEFADASTGVVPSRADDLRLAIGEDSAVVFVLVPPGRFEMGAGRPADPWALENESPVHAVELDAFFLSKYELTQAQWLRVTGENPSAFQKDGEHELSVWVDGLLHPVEQVSWSLCEEVLGRLGLVLPTEAQWEYAARAGTSTPWWTGDDPESLEGAANIADRTPVREGLKWPTLVHVPRFEDGFVVHAPVNASRANPFGLHDVLGNVWEWCRDDYAHYELPVRGPEGERLFKGTDRRVGRGGSFKDSPIGARSATRGAAETHIRDHNIGVRPARRVDG
jgi:formylglycine-generating enzyme required for sulfatase activity